LKKTQIKVADSDLKKSDKNISFRFSLGKQFPYKEEGKPIKEMPVLDSP